MPEMQHTPKEQLIIKAAKAGMTDKEFLSFQQMQEMHDTLKEIRDKEEQPFPEIPAMPEMPEMDMSETNGLLRQLVDKEDKPQEVRVSLKII